jgi:hypothetical protein
MTTESGFSSAMSAYSRGESSPAFCRSVVTVHAS